MLIFNSFPKQFCSSMPKQVYDFARRKNSLNTPALKPKNLKSRTHIIRFIRYYNIIHTIRYRCWAYLFPTRPRSPRWELK